MKYLLGLIVILVLFLSIYKYVIVEGFKDFDDTGQLCGSCSDKNFNQCLGCFNCGYCIDKWGNGKCIGGTIAAGPMNKENCKIWYTRDKWTIAKNMNENYRLSYGPKQSNRPIGIFPCSNCLNI